MPVTTKKATTKKAGSSDTVMAALAQHPGSTAAELADATGLGRSTITKTLAALATAGRVSRTAGQREGARRPPDTWTLPENTADPAGSGGRQRRPADGARRTGSTQPVPTATTATTSADTPPDAGHTDALPGTSAGRRLRKGELNGLVLDFLARHGQPITASAVGKAINRSGGAVANALERLETAGQVTRVSDKPRTYQRTTETTTE